MENFDEKLDKQFNRIQSMGYAMIIFIMALMCGCFVGVGFVVYRVLIHYGIL